MIKVNKEKVKIPIGMSVQYETKTREVYTCTDGKTFTDEDAAKNYENNIQADLAAMRELRLFVIGDGMLSDPIDNEGYIPKFCFNWHAGISKETRDRMHRFIYNYDERKMVDGWMLVEQTVYEVSSSSKNCDYDTSTYYVGPYDRFLAERERELDSYRSALTQAKRQRTKIKS